MILRLRRSLRVLALALALCAPSPSPADTLPRQRVIVKLDVNALPEAWLGAGEILAQRDAILLAQFDLFTELLGNDVELTQVYETIPYMALDVSQAGLVALAQSPLVQVINGDAFAAPDLAESAPLVGATQAWSNGVDGRGSAIAVLDTGIDASHPFLAGKVVAEACFSANGSCANHETAVTGPGSGAPCDFAPECIHGTHVAGIAAGAGRSFSGIARGAQLIAIQVFSRFSGPSCGGAPTCALSYVSDQVAALEHVYSLRQTYDVAAVNLSLGGGRFASAASCDAANTALKAAIDNLRAAGIATVVAAGNSGYTDALSAPGCISSAVSVGATTKADAIPSYSNSAAFLKLLAPGSSIVSAVPHGLYAYMSGTSMATPHVAGAFALMHQRDPSASVDAILARLRATGRSLADARNGRVFSRIALADALAGWGAPAIALTALDAGGSVVGGDRVTLTWTASAVVARTLVYFSRDGGATWHRVGRPVTGGQLVWQSPRVRKPVASCRVRVVAVDAHGRPLAADASARDFSLLPRPRA
jgi:subtilisin family serine protease